MTDQAAPSWRSTSLRRRLRWVLPTLCTACSLAAAAAIFAVGSWQRRAAFEGQLQQRHHDIAVVLRQREGRVNWPQGRSLLAADERVLVHDGQGRHLGPDAAGPRPPLGASRREGWSWYSAEIDLRSSGPSRRGAASAPSVLVSIGRSRQPLLDEDLRQISMLAVLVGMAGLIGLLAAAPLASVLLEPLRRLASDIDRLRPGEQALPKVTRPLELVPIAAALDGLLGRLDESLQRERRSAAHLAHELRTPLAGMRAVLELALRRERDASSYRSSLAEVAAIRDQTEALAERLLLLTRLELGQLPFLRQELDLGQVLAALWQEQQDRATARGLQVAIELPPGPACITGDRTLLAQSAEILVTNLCDHAEPGPARIVLVAEGRSWILRTENRVAGLRAQDLPRLGDLGWRADAGRGGGHAGLGLSLARRIAVLHAGRLEARLDDGVLTVCLVLDALGR